MRTRKTFLQTITFMACAALVHITYAADRYEEQLNGILNEYRAMPKTQDVGQLVEMHLDLTSLVKELQEADRKTDGASRKYWQKDYEEIGLYVEHYGGALAYTGKLLSEARARNPDSPYRKYTLFAIVEGDRIQNGFPGVPLVQRAELYLKEFPEGPYAADVHALVGFHYDDLAKVLRNLIEDEKDAKDYKYECFAPDITKEPYADQLQHATKLAVDNLERAIALVPPTGEFDERQEALQDLKTETSTIWHSCPD